MRVRLVAATICAIMALGTVHGSSPYHNDLGSGTDAPSLESGALLVPSDGSFSGHLLARGDTDWFARPDINGLSCVSLSVTSDAGAAAGLVSMGADGQRRVTTATVRAGETATISAVSRDAASWRAVLENTSESSAHRAYTMGWRTLLPSSVQGDAGTTADAPASGGWSVRPGCIGGTLGGVDVRDEYVFAASPGQRIQIGLAQAIGEGATLTLASPSGDVLTTLTADGVATLVLPESGLYTLTASSLSSPVTYLLALTFGPDPPGSGCKPTC